MTFKLILEYDILYMVGHFLIRLTRKELNLLKMNRNSVIQNGVYDVFLKEKRRLFIEGYDSGNLNNYNKKIFDEETLTICFKIYNANKARKRYGLEEMIKWCFVIEKSNHYQGYKLIFGTLTFNDDSLNKTSKITRRRYVSRFLKDKCESYIANIDFGDKDEREHYHFVALCKNDIKKNSWKYGYDYYRKIEQTKDGIQKAKTYLLKLNNHSYKSSTRNERVIMNKTKKGIDLIDVIVTSHPREYRHYKLQFLSKM